MYLCTCMIMMMAATLLSKIKRKKVFRSLYCPNAGCSIYTGVALVFVYNVRFVSSSVRSVGWLVGRLFGRWVGCLFGWLATRSVRI